MKDPRASGSGSATGSGSGFGLGFRRAARAPAPGVVPMPMPTGPVFDGSRSREEKENAKLRGPLLECVTFS